MQNRRKFLVSTGAMMITGCSGAINQYQEPQATLGDSFVGSGPKSSISNDSWWRALRNERLNVLVERGLKQNLGIQTAMERVAVAHAQLAATGAAALPSGPLEANRTISGAQGVPTSTVSTATATADLVLDIFGRVRAEHLAASANLDASRFDVATARLAFLGSLVGHYIDARFYQEALALRLQNVAAQRKTLDLVKGQQRIGSASGLDTAQAEAQLDQALALPPPLRAKFNAAVFGIATLLAEPAAPLMASLQRGAAQPYPRRGEHVGVPAELLRNRPDVRAAERRYAEAVAKAGVAEAQLYPSIKLSGSVTVSTTSSWSFGPRLSLPVFNRSALRARRRAAAAAARQAEMDWRQAVLVAVEEVQTELSNYAQRRQEAAALRNAVNSLGKVRDLYHGSYKTGSVRLFDLLSAQRNYADARLALAQSVREVAGSWVKLQIATGSGWATATPTPVGAS